MRPAREATLEVSRPVLRDLVVLAKPELTLLSVLTAVGGAYLGNPASSWILLFTFIGTLAVGAGAGALNMVLEQSFDALMIRTRHRPIPSGRLTTREGVLFGIFCTLAGGALLATFTTTLAALLALLTLVTYLFLYTPLKRLTPFATIVGAVPGALPPVIGWAAARGEIGGGAWSLFAILFFWQIPHFLSLAWVYRNDYARAGYKLLTVIDRTGSITRRQILIHAIVLLPASVLPTYFGISGSGYFLGALILSAVYLCIAILSCRSLSGNSARRLFLASLAYLPLLVLLMALDRI